MFFDGYIGPKRVINLSGASGVGRDTGFNSQRFEFRSVQIERERAARRLLQFLRHVVEYRRYVLSLRDTLPSLFESAESYIASEAQKRDDRNASHSGADNNGVSECLNKSHGAPPDTPSISENDNTGTDYIHPRIPFIAEDVKADDVAKHPVCMLLRVVTALARHDDCNDYSESLARCLHLFRNWFMYRGNNESIDLIMSKPLLNEQLAVLCCRFFSVVVFAARHREDDRNNDGNQTPKASDQNNTTTSPGGSGISPVSSEASSLPVFNFSPGQGFSSWLEAQRAATNNGTIPTVTFSTVAKSEVKNTPKRRGIARSPVTLSQYNEPLKLSKHPLSKVECDEVYLFVSLLKIISFAQLARLCRDCEITTSWYPEKLGRAFLNYQENHNTLILLLSACVGVIHQCSSKEDAVQLLVKFWALPDLRNSETYNSRYLLCAMDATIAHGYIESLSLIGNNCVNRKEFGPTLPEKAVSKEYKDTLEAITKNVEKSLRSSVPMTVSLNPEMWKVICKDLKAQVESVMEARWFLPFTKEILVQNGPNNSEVEGVTFKNDYNHAIKNSEELPLGPMPRGKTFVYQRLFINMFHLLRYVSAKRNKDILRDSVASILSVMLLCLQFVKEKDRKLLLRRLDDFVGLMGSALYANQGDRCITLTILLLLIPLNSWDYFSTDLDDMVLSNCKRKTVSNDELYNDSWYEVPEIDTQVANMMVTCRVPLMLANQFRKHYENCCGSSFSTLVSTLCAIQSNNGIFSLLWQIFAMVLQYCLKIMYDSEIISDTGSGAIFDMDSAVFVANVLNHFYWKEVSPVRPSKERPCFTSVPSFPGNTVCFCDIDVQSSSLFHGAKQSHFDDEYWGRLARKFNERFFRLQEARSRPMLIHEVERAVLTQMKSKHLDAPVMAVVRYIPNTISFETRLKLFIQLVETDKGMYRQDFVDFFDAGVNVIRRTHVVEDAMATLGCLDKHMLKQTFKVVFVDETGSREEGIDGGGLFKEFVTSICSVIFNPAYGIFEESPYDRSFVPSPNSSLLHDDHLSLFNFVGKLVGKTLYEHVLIEPVLSRLLLNLILKHRNTLDDFKLYDPELYRNLVSMRNMSPEEISSLGLTFTTGIASLDNSAQAEIVQGGSKMKVTKENLESFIHHFADFKCNRLLEAQASAFLKGLSTIIPLDWLRCFSPTELVYVISGSSDEIDVDDMEANTMYSGGYTVKSLIVVWFWEIMREFDNEERRMFLWFVTCCKRAPLLGFKQLYPRFCITRDVHLDNMPTVSTCTNLLKLPEYCSKEELRTKLVDAMTMSKGFGLA